MQRVLNTFVTCSFVFTALTLNQSNAVAQSGVTASPEPISGSVVCPPNVYMSAPEGCLPLGPSEYLTQIAVSGIPYPIPQLPAYSPPASLNETQYRYFKVVPRGAPLFVSLQDAVSNQPSSRLDPGTELYVSYVDGPIATNQGGAYYQLRSGYWIPAEGGRLGQFDPSFQGLEFSSQPRNAFGWVLGTVRTRTVPGLNSPETGNSLYRFNVVQIYATQTASNMIWDLVNPDEWVDATQVARVDLHATAPIGVTGNRWIEVNLFEQTLSVYDNNHLIFATMTSTGAAPFYTRPGIFHIYEKKPAETMSGSTEADRSDYYYLEDVPWTMYFDENRALHGAYWHNRFGYPNSHGCVNLSVGDAHWLYDWANLNDFVYVYDPSGKTPVDASAYGAGAP